MKALICDGVCRGTVSIAAIAMEDFVRCHIATFRHADGTPTEDANDQGDHPIDLIGAGRTTGADRNLRRLASGRSRVIARRLFPRLVRTGPRVGIRAKRINRSCEFDRNLVTSGPTSSSTRSMRQYAKPNRTRLCLHCGTALVSY